MNQTTTKWLARAVLPWLLVGSATAQGSRTYDGPWPPYSRAQCLSASIAGVLAEKGVSEYGCIQLIRSDGLTQAAKVAASQGFYLYEFGLWDVNSAGGVEPYAWIVNPKIDDDLKYVTITGRMFNAVGDPVRSSIDHRSTFSIRYTGPLSNAAGPDEAQWEPVGYNHSVKCLQVDSVLVEFMSRRKILFSGRRLTEAFHPAVNYKCK